MEEKHVRLQPHTALGALGLEVLSAAEDDEKTIARVEKKLEGPPFPGLHLEVDGVSIEGGALTLYLQKKASEDGVYTVSRPMKSISSIRVSDGEKKQAYGAQFSMGVSVPGSHCPSCADGRRDHRAR
jgi:hypothetical protein